MTMTPQNEIGDFVTNNNVQSCPTPRVFIKGKVNAPPSFTILGGSGGITGTSGSGLGSFTLFVSYACVTAGGDTTCETNYQWIRTN